MMMNEIEIIECPICMDEISGEKNKITTECGHCFHANCLMKNVSHNGFGCPYCRTAMAEEPADNDSDNEYDEFSIEEEGNDFSDNVLRGARWLFQRAEGEELDDEEDSVFEEEEEEVEEEPIIRPSIEYIVGKLVQRGVTMEDLVKSLLLMDHEEFQYEESFERNDSELYGKIRAIITSFQPAPVSLAPVSLAPVSLAPVSLANAYNQCFETCQYVPNCDDEISDGPQFIHNYETCGTYQSSRLRRHKAESDWKTGRRDFEVESVNSDDESVWISDDDELELVKMA